VDGPRRNTTYRSRRSDRRCQRGNHQPHLNDAHGTPLPPAVAHTPDANAILTAFMVTIGAAAVATFLSLLLRRHLDRIWMGRWQRDRLLVEATWSGRR
jgi:hypothetical protein